jgi:fucose 4-O-acetylase-like acetyltransferase
MSPSKTIVPAMNTNTCFHCNNTEADKTRPLILLMQRKEKINGVQRNHYKEFAVPVCSQCFQKIKNKSKWADRIGGTIFVVLVIAGFAFWIYGMFLVPNNESPAQVSLVLLALITIVGICLLLLVRRLSLPRHIHDYASVKDMKNEGWRVSPYFPMKNV